MEHEKRPEQDVAPTKESAPHDPAVIEDDLKVAVETVGAAAVQELILEVAVGEAKPEALLAWMDDLRNDAASVDHDSEESEHDQRVETLEHAHGMLPDFMADTDVASSLEQPDTGSDGDYFFSAVRKRRADEEEDGEDGGGGGGGGGGGDGGGDDAAAGDGVPAPAEPTTGTPAPETAAKGAAKPDRPGAPNQPTAAAPADPPEKPAPASTKPARSGPKKP